MKRMKSFGLVCAVATALAGSAKGDVIIWKNVSANWNVASNWTGATPARVPTTGDTAIIGQGTATINSTLSPAPDLIRLDSGGTAVFNTSTANNWVLNGGTFQGTATINVSGTTQLTADSVIKNTIGNGNAAYTISGAISEDATPRKLTFNGNVGDHTSLTGANTYSGGTIVNGQVNAGSAGALGTGPVTVNSGARLKLGYTGDYTFGTVTSNGGDVRLYGGNVAPQNTNLNLQGGTLSYAPRHQRGCYPEQE
jgi:hypothetical protein